jgi:hypothetical protein
MSSSFSVVEEVCPNEGLQGWRSASASARMRVRDRGRVDMTEPRLERRLGGFLAEARGDTLHVAVAYVTTRGVAALEAAASERRAACIELIAGLDDAFTQPDALARARRLGFEVRVTQRGGGRIFHPKLYWVEREDGGSYYCGSANLTGAALDANDELGVVVAYDGAAPDALAAHWGEWWASSQPLTETLLAAYRAQYDEWQRVRAELPEPPALVSRGRVFVIRGKLRGNSQSLLQTREKLGWFFGVREGGDPVEIRVRYRGTERPVEVLLHHDGATLQLNFGRGGLHHQLREELEGDDLLVLGELNGGLYEAEVVPGESPRARAILAACGNEPGGTFSAGVCAADVG